MKYIIGISLLLLTACDFADLEPIDGEQMCNDVGYAVSNRSYQCGVSLSTSNQRFESFRSDYNCSGENVENELKVLGLETLYSCADSIAQIPCDSVNVYGDDLSKWFSKSENCLVITAGGTSEVAEVETIISEEQCTVNKGRSVNLLKGTGAKVLNMNTFATTDSSWTISFWIKGDKLPTNSGIFGIEKEVEGRMSTAASDETPAVQRIRMGTGDIGYCTGKFDDNTLFFEMGGSSGTSGTYGGVSYYIENFELGEGWHHWTISRYHNSAIGFYIDGELVPMQYRNCFGGAKNFINWEDAPFVLGAINDRGEAVRGSGLQFDDLMIWERSWPTKEIPGLVEDVIDSSFINDPSLVGFFEMDTTEGTNKVISSTNTLSIELPAGAKLEADCAK